VGVGLFDDFEVASQLSRVEKTFQPDPGRAERYETRYQQFLEAYQRLVPLFDELQRN
jgi:xylulokinase